MPTEIEQKLLEACQSGNELSLQGANPARKRPLQDMRGREAVKSGANSLRSYGECPRTGVESQRCKNRGLAQSCRTRGEDDRRDTWRLRQERLSKAAHFRLTAWRWKTYQHSDRVAYGQNRK